MIDLHFVARGLAVGSRFPMDAAAQLAADHGISRVVDVRGEERDDEELLRHHGISLLHLPTADTHALSREMIRDGVAYVSEALDRGASVLVHCQHGIGRSALLALCVLVARGAAPLDAIARAKDARPVISPSPEQLAAFVAFAEEVRREGRARWKVPTLVEVAAIAYRRPRGDAPGEEPSAAATRTG